MKTFIYPFALTTICALAIGFASVTGCVQNTNQVPPKTPVGEVSVDRHDIPLGNDVDTVLVENKALTDFIGQYNNAQDDPSLKVGSKYKVTFDDFSQAYHVVSDTVNLTVHINEGKVVFAGVSADCGLPVEKEIKVANAVFKIMKARGNVPARVLAYMKDVRDRAEELDLQATEAYQRIDDTLKSIDPEEFLNGIHDEGSLNGSIDVDPLPETTLPPVDDIVVPSDGNP